MNPDTAQLDRACGVLLATAAGDALGAGYEYGWPGLTASDLIALATAIAENSR